MADSKYRSESAVTAWPRRVPCRTHDAGSKRVLVTTLGEIETPLADAWFDPVNDRVQLGDGSMVEHYYRDRLGIRFYQPIDKSTFPLPPCGWCSWYYYYQQITPEEVRLNAEWMGRRLLEYGARYCQLDDGWQGAGHGLGENRDWTTMDARFRAGLKPLADYIRAQGLEAGIWLAPHGQSNPKVVEQWDVFLRDKEGRTLSDTWEGKFLLDPTRQKSRRYMLDLFRGLCDAGYTYFKIDGQPIVVGEYRKLAGQMARPPSNPDEAYRETLAWIREALGPNRFLLGCWGTPVEGAGLYDGSRIGGDVVLGLEGFKVAAKAIMRYNHLHNIAWYCDPDVMTVRHPLPYETAKAWASAQGLTGQALLTSDRLPDLSADRVELIKRVFPAVDVRPLDLFDPGDDLKPIWDLKVAHAGRRYDVVGCFNFHPDRNDNVLVQWKEVGLKPDALYHVYDFWQKQYLGCWEAGFFAPVAAAGCTVLTLVEANDQPQLISTDRHITQGWIDLLRCEYDRDRRTWRGRSQLIGNDPYTLTFAFPRAKPTYRIMTVHVDGAAATFSNHQGWATVRLFSPKTRAVEWSVTFEPAEVYGFEVRKPPQPAAEMIAVDAFRLTWSSPYEGNAGYAVHVGDELLGVTPVNAATLRGLPANGPREVHLQTVWWDGRRSAERSTLSLEDIAPQEVHLSELEPRRTTQGWGSLERDRSVSGGSLRIKDKTYRKGLGSHSPADLEYYVGGQYARFMAEVGVDAANGKPEAKVTFEVWADDRKLWESGAMTAGDAAKPVDVALEGAEMLRLHVGESDDGKDYDHANWAEARLVR